MLCVVITNTRRAPTARSMAPPTAGTDFSPPVDQLARSPAAETSKAPRTQMSICPPLTMANESAWWKKAPPSSSVTGFLPALIRS